jgi:phage internal scaffolding protein
MTKLNKKEAAPAASRPFSKVFKKPSLTKQSFKAECDINNVMTKFEKHQQITHLNNGNPAYGDFSTPEDYQQSFNTVLEAQKSFAALPSDVRAKFTNDPIKFLEFVNNPENEEEIKSLGLTKKLDNPVTAIATAVASKIFSGITPPEHSTSDDAQKSTPKGDKNSS